MAKYINPWAKDESFVDLGPVIYNEVYYDAYALLNTLPDKVSFGARYSDEEGDYISGCTILDENNEWQFFGPIQIAVAAVKFFANKHDVLIDRTHNALIHKNG